MCPKIQYGPLTTDQVRQSQGRDSIYEGKGPHRQIRGDMAHRKDVGGLDKLYMETPRPLSPPVGS